MNYKRLSPFKLVRFLFTSFVLLVFSLHTNAQTESFAGVGNYASGSKIPKSVFTSLPSVGVYVRDVALELKYTVTSYTLKLADDEGGIRRISCQGSSFSALAKQSINDYTKAGDVIVIENIRAKNESGAEVKLPSLVYYIE